MHRVYTGTIRDNPDAVIPFEEEHLLKERMLADPLRLALAASAHRMPGDERFLALTHLTDTAHNLLTFAYQVVIQLVGRWCLCHFATLICSTLPL